MTPFVTRKIRLWFSLTFLVLLVAVAQGQTGARLPIIGSFGEKVLALAPWRVAGKQGHLFCQVSQHPASDDDRSPMRVLTIYREEEADQARIYDFRTSDSLLNVYALGDYDGRLFTTWVAGSAYHLRIWAFVDGIVKQVLDEGTKIVPEFLYDDLGRESILITDPGMENGKWTVKSGTTRVFKWGGQSYEKIGTVPWRKRLQCLSKESCASVK